MKRIYLNSIPLDDALKLWAAVLQEPGMDKPLPAENISIADAAGRITAAAVMAKISLPSYHSAAMDGYAVKFSETFGASETNPIRLKTGWQAIYVDTGDPVPEGFNAVIMIEDVNPVNGETGEFSGLIEIIEPATPWQNVRTVGEDIVATELIIPENHRIRAADLGALLGGGHTDIMVRKKPRIAIIPTGSELVEPGTELKRGAIVEYNSRILSSLVTEWGGEPARHDIVPDDIEKLKIAIAEACKYADMVIVNAGSSAGRDDFTAQAIKELGRVIIHGVAIKPGKPVILGIVNEKPVLGIPGYPVSAYITFNLFAKSVIHKWQGINPSKAEKIKATLSRQTASQMGQEEFVRVRVGVVGDRTIATPVSRGAGVIMSLVRSDGIMQIPSMSEGFGAGSEVEVELMRPLEEIRNTITCIGSHDSSLDILSNFLRKRFLSYSLSSAHVGSMGGLIALKKAETHMAGVHLLDEETGQYNIPFIQRISFNRKISLINLAHRQQGLLVKKGNPKNIKGFEDLLRTDVSFINRQSGSGTRLLLDKCIRDKSLNPICIKGYGTEEYTHLGVASAVLTGMADTGLAILSAARALGLDFIPVAKERYDLAVPNDLMSSGMLQALLVILREDKEFREAVLNLGGYDLSDTGKVIYEGA